MVLWLGMRIILLDVCNPSLLMNLALTGLDDSFLNRGHAIFAFSWNTNFHKNAHRGVKSEIH